MVNIGSQKAGHGKEMSMSGPLGLLYTPPPWNHKALGDVTLEERDRIILDNKICLVCLLHKNKEMCFRKRSRGRRG